MKRKCLACTGLDLKQHPSHARIGFGRCKFEQQPGVFVSVGYERECKDYKEAPEAVKRAREVWHNGGT